MSFLLSKSNELGYKALLAVNGGCSASVAVVRSGASTGFSGIPQFMGAQISSIMGPIGYSGSCSGSSSKTTTSVSSYCSGSGATPVKPVTTYGFSTNVHYTEPQNHRSFDVVSTSKNSSL
ncbi:MAG: hypothetical protein MJ188_03720 [Treponema sp.]|nr:hypothetical protein [Treponema sp.]